MQKYIITASLLSADFARLGEEAKAAVDAGVDMIHLDIMDNHYVPNLTFGPLVCRALRDYGIKVPIDVHLMVEPVDQLIIEFAKAGATYITFHPEASLHIDRSLQLIRANGCKSGLALNPATPLEYLHYVKDKLDMILMMTVNPGFGGQSFIPGSLEKIQLVRQWLDKNKIDALLAVDGGVKVDNIKRIADAGANMFIVGSGIYQTPDYNATVKALRKELGK